MIIKNHICPNCSNYLHTQKIKLGREKYWGVCISCGFRISTHDLAVCQDIIDEFKEMIRTSNLVGGYKQPQP